MLIQWRASSQWVVLRSSPSSGRAARALVGTAIAVESNARNCSTRNVQRNKFDRAGAAFCC